MKTSESNPADWYSLAADRLQAADAVRKDVGPTYAGVELLHEAVERYLKGYLVSKGWLLKRTHDLTELLAEATAFDHRFAKFRSLTDNLTDQFWSQHYPGGDLTDVGSDYDPVRSGVAELVAVVLSAASGTT